MPLEVDFLRHFGWEAAWVEALKKTVGPGFLPIQEKAIQQGRLFEGRSLMVVGPTSCGKGLVGELAGLHQVRQGRPGLVVVPTKALAEQRLEELRRRYRPLGLHVVQSSRDRREADGDIAAGRYHLAIVVAEKLLALLSQHPQLFAPVGTVVVDELQTLFDEERGADLELLLTRLLREERLQLIGLSAVIEQPAVLAEWLGGELVEETERPVELRQGVLCQGVFHYRRFNAGGEGRETFEGVGGDSEEEILFTAARHFAERGEMTLIFCASKAESFAWAERLSAALALPPAEEALAELDRLEENLATEGLRRYLASGVAVHNSDLTWPQRRLVEKYAARGNLRILCSTSTLSEGVNLPIVNTFIPRTVYRARPEELARGRPPRPERLTRADFRNMTGRSGRLGQAGLPQQAGQPPFGRGLLVSPYPGDVEPLMRLYIEQPGAPGRPRLLQGDLGPTVLKLVATGSARTEEEVVAFLRDSLSGRQEAEAKGASSLIEREATESLVSRLVERGYLQASATRLEVTPLGLVAARSGACPETLEHLSEFVHSVEDFLALEVLLALALSPDGALQYLPLRRSEWRSRRYLNELFRRLEATGDLERPWLAALFQGDEAAAEPLAAAVKKALLLWDWISAVPSMEIEQRYRVYSGLIEKLADGFAWLAQSLAEVGFIEGWPESLVKQAERLSRRLKAGLPEEALELEPLYERGLNRTALLRLMQSGADSIDAVEELPRGELTRLLGRAQAELLYARDEEEEISPQPASLETAPEAPLASGEEIRLSGLRLSRSRPDRLGCLGKEIPLTGKEFDLLWVLAEEAGKCVSYDELLNRVWPDVVVEQQQISAHKSRILKKVRRECGKMKPPLIRTIRGRGLLLELPQ